MRGCQLLHSVQACPCMQTDTLCKQEPAFEETTAGGMVTTAGEPECNHE